MTYGRLSSAGREWLYHEAGDEARNATRELEWWWDHAASVWRSAKLTADGNACSACGEDLGSHQYHGGGNGSCECVERVHREAFQAHVDAYKARAVMVEWQGARIPDRYEDARFDNFEAREGTEVALASAKSLAESFKREPGQRGLLLVGPFGSGKTHLAVATAYRALDRTLVRPHFVSSVGLIRDTKGGEKLNHKPVENAIAAELLILDDLGQVGRTDFDRELIFSIVSERYDDGAPILATSNLPPDRLGDLLGGALASRLHEACEVAFLTASDYRKARRGDR